MKNFSPEFPPQTETPNIQKQTEEEKLAEVMHDKLEPRLEEMYQDFKKRPDALEIQKNRFTEKLKDLKSLIDTHQINCILGDDKSGRIPALVLGKAINNIYSARGQDAIPTLFIDPHMYKWINDWGGYCNIEETAENKEQLDQTRKDTDQKISELFTNANLSDGTVLLVSDYIKSQSTVGAFKEMVEKNNLKMVTVLDPFWHPATSGTKPNIGNHHGLAEDYDYPILKPVIHAKSLWKEINNDELSDKEKIKLIRGYIPALNDIDLWPKILLAVKKEVDDSISTNLIEKLSKIDVFGANGNIVEDLLTTELNSDQIKNLYSYIKKIYFLDIRHDIPDFSKKLSQEYLEK